MIKENNIVLIGFMGVGKTEVGKLLAKKLKLSYLDTDEMIEKEQGRTINEIFSQDGEEDFRDMETALLDKISGKKGNVVSTGGGIILRPGNVKKMKDLGPLVLLWSDPEAIYKRLKDKDDRPLLKVPDPKKKIQEILAFREPIYRNIADLEVDTSSLSPEKACNRIIEFIEKDVTWKK